MAFMELTPLLALFVILISAGASFFCAASACLISVPGWGRVQS
jgi:hypothetical protein